mgnify:CR=1 FL=1
MFANLNAEMARHDVLHKDVMELLKGSRKTAWNKMNGRSGLTWNEMKAIRDKYFPKMTIDYLFFEEVTADGEASEPDM